MSEISLPVELEDVQKAVRISKLYRRDHWQLDRNPNLAYIVHATLHFIQFLVITTIEIFHHVHHAIHKQLKQKDPNLPSLHSERNIMLIINLPFNVAISLSLCFTWLLAKNFRRKLDFSLAGCTIQSALSFMNAIVVMRQAQIHLNQAEVPHEDIIENPIFIHCFIICMFSIFGFSINQMQFWLLLDCIQWRQKQRKNENMNVNKIITDKSQSSRDIQYQMSDRETSDGHSKLKRISSPDKSPKIENDPVNLYCCCVDYWNYFRLRNRHVEINHEFQVVYIM